MLFPKKVKHRKHRKGRIKGVARKGTYINFGSYGLVVEANGYISARQIEASRRAIIRYLRKGGKMWIRIFPHKPITRKGQEVPMGGGKGSVDHYATPVKEGRVVFEIDGIPEEKAREALRKAGDKLPMKTKFVKKIN
jgi:large subunit ribosomal protein L16